MALAKKFTWDQMAPLLDPFTILAASMTSPAMRSCCVSRNGLLIVPVVSLDFMEEDGADPLVKSLPAIDKAEVTHISINDFEDPQDGSDLDCFALCVGWLLGPFTKLRAFDLCTGRSIRNACPFVTVLRNLQHHCRALEILEFPGYGHEVIKALPSFRNLRQLTLLTIETTPGCPAAVLIDKLAACTASLRHLEDLRCDVVSSVEDCTTSWQRCMDGFPLKRVRIMSWYELSTSCPRFCPSLDGPPAASCPCSLHFQVKSSLCWLPESLQAASIICTSPSQTGRSFRLCMFRNSWRPWEARR